MCRLCQRRPSSLWAPGTGPCSATGHRAAGSVGPGAPVPARAPQVPSRAPHLVTPSAVSAQAVRPAALAGGPGLPVAAAAAVTTGRSQEQRFPPQRSAACARPNTERGRSPTPSPPLVRPPLPPPSAAGSPASAQQRPGRARATRLGGAAPGVGAVPHLLSPRPNGGVPRESQVASPEPRGSVPGLCLARGAGPGNPGTLETPKQGLSFLNRERGGEKGGLTGDASSLWRRSA